MEIRKWTKLRLAEKDANESESRKKKSMRLATEEKTSSACCYMQDLDAKIVSLLDRGCHKFYFSIFFPSFHLYFIFRHPEIHHKRETSVF